ncbi:MAG: hypothetical protein JSW45_10810 [Thiotrichales bacterium]|nr:MAG: hypothetical protein JSW45_10810 [Thiotrichales bacterium]
MKKVRKACLLIVLLVGMSSPQVMASPFSQGSQSVAVILGSGSAFNDDYLILGLGYGYYVINGLELGIDAQFWMSGDPSITKLSPKITYVFTQPERIKPYLGAFYRRTFVDEFDDFDSIGYRAGLNFMGQGNFFFGLGFVYEEYRSCSETVFSSCSDTYPEIVFSFSI